MVKQEMKIGLNSIEKKPVDSMQNLVTVIIVNLNGENLLKECLEGIKSQSFNKYEIIVVDNGSKDNSVEFVSTNFPDVKLISLDKNYGFAKANNIAIEACRSKYVALINNDAIADQNWLEYLVDALEKNPQAGFAASKMMNFNIPDTIDRAGDGYSIAGAGVIRGRGGKTSKYYTDQEWVFGACAGAAMYTRNMLIDIGTFDEEFFLIYEDVDLSFRAQLAGYKCIYEPKAIVYHKSSHTIGKDSDVSIYYGHRNIEWTYIQNVPIDLIFLTIIPHFIYIILAFCFFSLKGSMIVYLRAKTDAFKGLPAALSKRRQVQKRKIVSSRYIYKIMETEFFIRRYSHHCHK